MHPSCQTYGTTWRCFSCGAGGTVIDLGTLDGYRSSEAFGINSAGQVVGRADEPTTAGAPDHAFLYTDGVGIQDLNALIPAGSGWVLTEARAINDTGFIAEIAAD